MGRERGLLAVAGVLLMLALVAAGAARAQPVVRLATTTSTDNSGLLKFILPAFSARTGVRVQVIPVGTGKALELGKNGDVDVVLVHARAAEDQFVAAGHGVNRRDVMHNDFVIVGPAADPARVAGLRDVIAALKKVAASGARFISRGDNSGTDQMEQSYWREAGVRPAVGRQLVAGVGMGEALTMAADLQAYLLTDRASFASHRARTGLVVLVEGDAKMFNPYGIIAVNPKKYPQAHFSAAMQLIDWLVAADGQRLIAQFRIGGQQMFFPATP